MTRLAGTSLRSISGKGEPNMSSLDSHAASSQKRSGMTKHELKDAVRHGRLLSGVSLADIHSAISELLEEQRAEARRPVALPDGIHQRFAEAVGAPPIVELSEGLHAKLARALGR